MAKAAKVHSFLDKDVDVQINCEIPRQRVPYLGISVMRLRREGALYQVYSTQATPGDPVHRHIYLYIYNGGYHHHHHHHHQQQQHHLFVIKPVQAVTWTPIRVTGQQGT